MSVAIAAALLLTPALWDHVAANPSSSDQGLPSSSAALDAQKEVATDEPTSPPTTEAPTPTVDPEPVITTVTISAAGDCTFGLGIGFGYQGSFNDYFDKYGPEHVFKGVLPVFGADDYTIVNLEGPLTERGSPVPKTFNFRGPAKHAEALTAGSVDAVTLANNHSMDYGEIGYEDTKVALDQVGITHFGYQEVAVDQVKGIKIGLIGAEGWDDSAATRDSIAQKLADMDADIKIVSFHWGIEREYHQSAGQISLAHHTIDSGADMVLGHHPHVLQGVEMYNDKPIVYSLGNFSFGGNQNPSDKDAMIFQADFRFVDGVMSGIDSRIIPVSISSQSGYNDYSPTILEGDAKERVLQKVLNSSTNYTCCDPATDPTAD